MGFKDSRAVFDPVFHSSCWDENDLLYRDPEAKPPSKQFSSGMWSTCWTAYDRI